MSHQHQHGDAGHAHGLGDAHTHDFAAANKAYFDEHAHKLEDMHAGWREMARKEVDAMRTQWPALFDKERTVVLDFACGIGMISEQLVPHVKKIVGVDISQVSVDRYNTLATEKLGLTPETMKAACIELKGEPGELEGTKFDLVVCCASYHHFASIDDTTHLLASFLKPGGALLTHHGLVPHRHGIAEAQLRAVFEGAGLGAFELKDAATQKLPHDLGGADTTWFVARGVKPE
ncbi:S-adenosyl-L-methionine-dependent methyltransferase [Ganoderma leucocontextum]|nr:S-adenosyl-L-methionine-dependent methyltransferase [Ganoderma leucocontextum]